MTTAVVVTYRSREWIRGCLESLGNLPKIVVDNASDDGTADLVATGFPEARLIRRRTNGGFAVAVNDAIRSVPGEDVLLVNPDVVVDLPGIAKLSAYLAAHPSVGIVAPVLRYPDGRQQESVRSFPNPLAMLARRSPFGRTRLGRRLLAGYIVSSDAIDAPRPVDWAIGAAMLVRGTAIQAVGGMPEWIFLYGEDLEWCIRMWQCGWQVHVDPRVTFVHQYVRLSRRTLDLRSAPVRHHWASLLKIYGRHPGLLLGRGPSEARRVIKAAGFG